MHHMSRGIIEIKIIEHMANYIRGGATEELGEM